MVPSGRKFILAHKHPVPLLDITSKETIIKDDSVNIQTKQKNPSAASKEKTSVDSDAPLHTLQRNVTALDLQYGKPITTTLKNERSADNLDSLSQDSYGTSDYDRISKISVITAPLHQNKKPRLDH